MYSHEGALILLCPGQGVCYRTSGSIKTIKFLKHSKHITFQSWIPVTFRQRNLFRMFEQQEQQQQQQNLFVLLH